MTATVVSPPLTHRTLLLAKLETTYNVDPLPVPSADAFLCESADVQVDPTVLERMNYRPSLSKTPIGIGRKLVQIRFRHELKGSGTIGTPAKVGTLMRGCALTQTVVAATAAAEISSLTSPDTNTVLAASITLGKTAAPTTNYGYYNATVVLGGASATAKVRVSGIPFDAADLTILMNETFSGEVFGQTPLGTITTAGAPLAVTYTLGGTFQAGDVYVFNVGGYRIPYIAVTGDTNTTGVATSAAAAITAFGGPFTASATTDVITITFTGLAAGVALTSGTTALLTGASGASMTLAWSGSLTLGDAYYYQLLRPGVHYTPISTGFESLTIYAYYDGMLHRITGCLGTVQFQGDAGKFAYADFTFHGQYEAPYDAPLPLTPAYETTKPHQVELAQFIFGYYRSFRAASFTWNLSNTVTPRDDLSQPDGYYGFLITDRKPEGGVNPEQVLESVENVWEHFTNADNLLWHVRVGTVPGNIVEIMSNSAQISGNRYQDRNSIRVYDMTVRFSAVSDVGDDELRCVFA